MSSLIALTDKITSKKREAEKQMAQITLKMNSLRRLDDIIDHTESVINKLALHLAEMRCGKHVLAVNRMMYSCYCPYCRCLSSPFRDGLNAVSDGPLDETKTLMRLQHVFTQALRSSVAWTAEKRRRLVTSIHPAVLDKVGFTSEMLLQLLEACSPGGTEKSLILVPLVTVTQE
jgi:hypothetical protein